MAPSPPSSSLQLPRQARPQSAGTTENDNASAWESDEKSARSSRRKATSCKSRCATLPCSDDDDPSAENAQQVTIDDEQEEATSNYKSEDDIEVFDELLLSHRLKELLGPADALVKQSRCEARVGDYRIIQQIGRGSYGQVWEARGSSGPDRSGERNVAIKVISKSSYASKKRMHMLADEINVMRRVTHKNVISAKEVLHGREHIFVVMELAQMNINEYRDEYGENLKHSCIRTIMKGVLDGLTYLHSNGIAHMDLKPENIMILRDMPPEKLTADDIRICDLGFSVVGDMNGSVTSGSKRGTAGMMAPEVYTACETAVYDATSADVWSLGVILLDLVGCTPYSWMDLFKRQHLPIFGRMLDKKLMALQSKLEANRDLDPPLVDLIVRMLCVTPSGRLTAEQALNHSWVSRPPQEDLFQIFFKLLRPDRQ